MSVDSNVIQRRSNRQRVDRWTRRMTSKVLEFESTCSLFILILVTQFLAAQSTPPEAWTGGFYRDGSWVAVNVRFDPGSKKQAGTADILCPTFGGAENVINAALENPGQTETGLHFEIPVRSQKLVFDGQQQGVTRLSAHIHSGQMNLARSYVLILLIRRRSADVSGFDRPRFDVRN